MSEDREAKKLSKYKEKIVLKPNLKKIRHKYLLVGSAVAILICLTVTVTLNYYYKLGIKKVIETNAQTAKKIIKNTTYNYVSSDSDNKDELYNTILNELDLSQIHENNKNHGSFDYYNDSESGHYFQKAANGLADYLGVVDISQSDDYATSYVLSDNSDEVVIGSERENIYIALLDGEKQDIKSFNIMENYDGEEGTYGIYAYKPSPEVIDKICEWGNMIRESDYYYTDFYEVEMSDEIFVDGYNFVPRSFSVTFSRYYDDNGQRIEKVVDKIDIVTDEKDYEGWKSVKRSDCELELTDGYGFLVKDGYSSYHSNKDRVDIDNPDVVVRETVEAADGHMYEIKICGACDLFADWGKKNVIIYFAVIYGIVFISMRIVVYIVSKYVYQKREAVYEVFSYKRTTGNAAAHDLKSPLMAVLGYAENMAEDISKKEQDEYAKKIIETVDGINENIRDMKRLGSIEENILYKLMSGKTTADIMTNMKTVNVEEKIKKYIESNRERIENKKLIFNVNGQCSVKCEETWMTHLLDNLLGNAIKYSEEGGQINIRLKAYSLVVENDYKGIIDVTGDKLKEAFVKGDNSRHTEGSGVGLSIVDNIVRIHGWTMDLDTRNGRFVVKIKM